LFRVGAGEDEDIKRMMWVVENLQEELLAADQARMAADEQVKARARIMQALQACLFVCMPRISSKDFDFGFRSRDTMDKVHSTP